MACFNEKGVILHREIKIQRFMNKKISLLIIALATLGIANAQNSKTMEQDSTKTTMQKIEDGVVGGYKAIENGVVNGYTAIQDGVVEGFTKVSDAFIMKFFAKKGETIDEAKERMKAEEAKLHQENEDRVAASRQRGRESVERARNAGKKQ